MVSDVRSELATARSVYEELEDVESTVGTLALLTDFLDFLWTSFLLLAPMLLLGLFLAGIIHVLVSRQLILKWLRHDSLKSVASAAALGVPIPLCSCSVVPVVAEMRRKGASRSSCMSFLITAPETGADSILVTHAFFGPIAAVVRPLISFVTAVVAGIFCIGLIRQDTVQAGVRDHDHCHDHCHDHGVHKPLLPHKDDCYVRPAQLKDALFAWARSFKPRAFSWVKPDFYRQEMAIDQPATTVAELDFKTICKHVFRYGFVEVADDILFALLVGVALGGVLYLAIPSDLMTHEYARWLAYPVMVIVGVPLYICASASTPIAAALVAKGFSPGAALIFLMTGPATNTGTIAIIVNQFGARFSSVYVGCVIAVTVVLGILVDALLLFAGVSLAVNLEPSHATAVALVQWGGAFALVALIVWRFRAGAWKSGYADMLANLRPASASLKRVWGRLTRHRIGGALSLATPMGWMIWALALAALLASGLVIVPPGSTGYGRLFGEVTWRDLPPGLHYLAPRPFLAFDAWPVREVKSLSTAGDYEYVSGDLNLVSVSVNVQYRVDDAYVYHYRTEEPQRVLADAVRNQLRNFVAVRDLDHLLNVEREDLERSVAELFDDVQQEPALLFNAVELVKVSLCAIHPVAESINSFREISSAQEDRERIIVNAQRFMVALIPQAHGNAAYEVQQAKGEAFRKIETSDAEAKAIRVVAAAVRGAPDVLQNMLWRERMETALAGKDKIIVPNRRSHDRVAVWKQSAAATAEPRH